MCVIYTLGEGERGLETVCLACMVNEIPIIPIVSDEVRIHLVRSAAVYAIHKEIGDRRGEGGEGAEEKGETFVQNYYLYGYDNNKCKLKTIEGRTKNEGAVGFL